MASDPELKKTGSKGSSPLGLVLPPFLMCHLQSLPLCVLFQWHRKSHHQTRFTSFVCSSKQVRFHGSLKLQSPYTNLFQVFWIVLGFFLFSNIFPYSFKFPFYGAIIYFSSHMYRAPAFFVVRLLWIYISWVLIALSAVSVKASLRYRSELSLERRKLMLGGTTFDLLPVENKPAGTHSRSEQHNTPF